MFQWKLLPLDFLIIHFSQSSPTILVYCAVTFPNLPSDVSSFLGTMMRNLTGSNILDIFSK